VPPPLAELSAELREELVAVRRDLHAHPELGNAEHRTTDVVAARLEKAGLTVRRLPGTGLICDIGDPTAPAVALRADLDALPVADVSAVEFASTVPGVAHACGHDVHTSVVLGAGVLLARLHDDRALPGRVRLLFQPAEEITPGGAKDVIDAGGLEGVSRLFAVHCDPRLDVGRVGLRAGPITSASDHVLVRLSGPGGHTSRPHLTADVVFALGQLATTLPGVLGRRLDPRAGVNLTWGRISAGVAPNAVPTSGELEGTLRVLDVSAWQEAGGLLDAAVRQIVAPYGVDAEVVLTRSVPPVDNDAGCVHVLQLAAHDELGADAEAPTEQSLGGEDFGWYLRHGVPGALARLGTRTPGGPSFDLHQGDLVVDEDAIEVGVRLLVATALRAVTA
jgi:amidohydrolase